MSKEDLLQAEIDKLKNELLDFKKRTRYGLVWVDVPEAFDNDAENKLPILEEVKELAIQNDDGKPTHILIEGDNYHALTCLNYTHKEAVDVIYIDPPYNTGSDGFRYKDKRIYNKNPDGTVVPKNHPLRHSYWLSFMAKRLELAKNLLKDTGVIFISIDDNEVAQLKLLCDGVFGEDNFIGNICWLKKRKGSFLSNTLVSLTEYILVYKKSNKNIKLYGSDVDNEESQPIVKKTNSKNQLDFKANFVTTKLKDGIYSKGIYGNGDSSTELLTDIEIQNGLIITNFSVSANFVWSQEYLEKEIKNGTLVMINTDNFQPRVIRVNNESYKSLPSFFDGKTFNATNEDAYETLVELFQTERVFDYSKPVNLIKKLINSVTNFSENAIILDFFAGSGTTIHAVMELNKEDNDNRQCILVTDNEQDICEKVCYPRVQRVIEGYAYTGNKETALIEKKITWTDFNKNEKLLKQVADIEQANAVFPEYDKITKEIKDGKLKVSGLKTIAEKVPGLGNSLKYYRTGFVGEHHAREANDLDKTQLAHKAGALLAIAENTLEEKENSESYQIFENANGATATGVYFRESLSDFATFCEKIDALKKSTVVYVFDWGNGEAFESSFEHNNKVTVKSIPNPIVNIYKTIFMNATPLTEEANSEHDE